MDYRDLVAQSMEELRLKTEAHDRLWRLGEADWSVDQDAGEIVFSAPNGMVARCVVQIIGTFNTVDGTWLWGWDHPSVQPPLRAHAARVREYGESNAIAELTTSKVSTTEERCWEFAALACKLNEAQGAYRGPSGPTLVFMTFGEPKLTGTAEVQEPEHDRAAGAEPGFTAVIPADVKNTLTEFIKALHDWEVGAHEAYERGNHSSAAMEAAKESHDRLIREWCVADLTPQPISFGSAPSHNPETERFVSAATADDTCRVRTQHTDSNGFVADYEYHLRREEGRWLVENLFYVDDEGKYEML